MFINMNLDNVVEPKPVPSGRYNTTISSAEHREGKKDIRVTIGIDDHFDAPNVSHYISLPKPDDDAGKVAFKSLMLKRFLMQYGIPNSSEGFAVEDFAGAVANVQLDLSEPDDNGAVYNRLRLDKLPNETGTFAKAEKKS